MDWSTVTQDFEPYDPKRQLSSHDLKIKKEFVEEDLQPGDPEYYPKLQYVYQSLQKAEEAVETSKNTPLYQDEDGLHSLCRAHWKSFT